SPPALRRGGPLPRSATRAPPAPGHRPPLPTRKQSAAEPAAVGWGGAAPTGPAARPPRTRPRAGTNGSGPGGPRAPPGAPRRSSPPGRPPPPSRSAPPRPPDPAPPAGPESAAAAGNAGRRPG